MRASKYWTPGAAPVVIQWSSRMGCEVTLFDISDEQLKIAKSKLGEGTWRIMFPATSRATSRSVGLPRTLFRRRGVLRRTPELCPGRQRAGDLGVPPPAEARWRSRGKCQQQSGACSRAFWEGTLKVSSIDLSIGTSTKSSIPVTYPSILRSRTRPGISLKQPSQGIDGVGIVQGHHPCSMSHHTLGELATSE